MGFRVDNSELQSSAKALGYRKSRDISDKDPRRGASWNSIVEGNLQDGWLNVKQAQCPSGHGLNCFQTRHGEFFCDFCDRKQPEGVCMLGCRACNFDVCMQSLPQTQQAPLN